MIRTRTGYAFPESAIIADFRRAVRKEAGRRRFSVRGELQRQRQLRLNHGGPRRVTESCYGNFRSPRRATKGHEVLQRQFRLNHGGPRRVTENCNGNFRSPRRATKGREVLQRQLRWNHGGPRRVTENCNGNFKCPRRASQGHGDRLFDLLRFMNGALLGPRQFMVLAEEGEDGGGLCACWYPVFFDCAIFARSIGNMEGAICVLSLQDGSWNTFAIQLLVGSEGALWA